MQELQEQIPAKTKPGAIITAVYELSGLELRKNYAFSQVFETVLPGVYCYSSPSHKSRNTSCEILLVSYYLS